MFRYVHSLGTVTVKLNQEGQYHKQILMFSWCSKCQSVSKTVAMQQDTWHMSFGKYLEMRFHSHSYRRRNGTSNAVQDKAAASDQASSPEPRSTCTHSIHRDHVQYFTYNGIVVSFIYTPIAPWEISLPQLTVALKTHKPVDHATCIDEVKAFSARGHELYATFHDRVAQLHSDVEFPMLTSLKRALNNDQVAFREKVGCVQTLLTEPIINGIDVDDAMIVMKKTLADNIETWIQRISEATVQYRALTSAATNKDPSASLSVAAALPPTLPPTLPPPGPCVSATSAIVAPMSALDTKPEPAIDPGTICTEDLRSDPESPNTVDSSHGNVFGRELSADSDPAQALKPTAADAVAAEPRASTSSDKKSVKTILRELLPSDKPIQLLPASPIPPNEHLTLPVGCVPVLVHDQDYSSVIAYCLASPDYRKRLDQSVYCDSHRKSYDSNADLDEKEPQPTASDKDKPKSRQIYVEVNFGTTTTATPTQFACKVYFARDFDLMRMRMLRANSGDDKSFAAKASAAKTDADDKLSMDIDRKTSANSCDERTDEPTRTENEAVRVAFIRSLSKSLKWEARGGKSGSKFCKTLGGFTLDCGRFPPFLNRFIRFRVKLISLALILIRIRR